MEKYVTITGITTMVLMLISVILGFVNPEFSTQNFITISGLLIAFVYTPLFFVYHKQKYDAYKTPCYIASAIVSGFLALGGLLSGFTNSLGEPNIYSGSFLFLCYMVAILFFKPATKQRIILIVLSSLMIYAVIFRHLSEVTV